MEEFEVKLVRLIKYKNTEIESKIKLFIKAPRFDYAVQQAKEKMSSFWVCKQEYKF